MLENDTLNGQNNVLKRGTRLKSKTEKTGTLSRPLVSIITTSLNREKSIERAIISVLNQTYTNIEYIIIDGYSTDGTTDIITAYENQIDYWISEKDGGPTEAFNKGIIASRGQIILHLCSDEYCKEDYVEKIVQAHKDNPECGYFYGNTIFIDDLGKLLFSVSTRMPSDGLIGGSHWLGTKKEVFDKIGLFDTAYPINSDFEFILRMSKSYIKGCYVPVTRYMQYGGISQKYWFRSYRERVRAEIKYGRKRWNIYRGFLTVIIRISFRNFLEKIFGQKNILKFRKLWNKDLTFYDKNTCP